MKTKQGKLRRDSLRQGSNGKPRSHRAAATRHTDVEEASRFRRNDLLRILPHRDLKSF
jgi:hypothetical protein